MYENSSYFLSLFLSFSEKKIVKGVAKEIVRPYQNPLDKKKQ